MLQLDTEKLAKVVAENEDKIELIYLWDDVGSQVREFLENLANSIPAVVEEDKELEEVEEDILPSKRCIVKSFDCSCYENQIMEWVEDISYQIKELIDACLEDGEYYNDIETYNLIEDLKKNVYCFGVEGAADACHYQVSLYVDYHNYQDEHFS